MKNSIMRKEKDLCFNGGKVYLFDVPALVKAMEEKSQIAKISLVTELELVAEDHSEKKKMATRINKYLKGKEQRLGIKTIKLLGLVFGGDEMAFLREVSIETIIKALMKYENDF